MTRRVVGPLGLRGRCTHMYLSVSALTASGEIVLLLDSVNVYTAIQYPACNTVREHGSCCVVPCTGAPLQGWHFSQVAVQF